MKKWYKVALLNLVVLAVLGLLLRYKINFPLPLMKQENLLHAHSHFAFNGWISFLLELLLLNDYTNDYKKSTTFWDRFFIASTIVNYGMIISFAWVGYAGISIVISTIALLLSYVFAYKLYKALPKEGHKKVSVQFVKASLFFLVLSSLGPFALPVITALKAPDQYWFHNALYFFLHFQYNGWFTFAVLSLLIKKLERSALYNVKYARIFFRILVVTCIPTYFFTTLWHHRPLFVTIIIIVTATLQFSSLYFLLKLLYQNTKTVYSNLPAICRWLYSFAIGAYVLKVMLQFFAVHPQVAQFAFGFRPVIIGYLHLIFLAFVSMYLLSLMADKKIISLDYNLTSVGLTIFAAGVILNEILLAIQGVAAIYNLYLPHLNLLLFINTFTLVTGAILLFIAVTRPVTHSKTILKYQL